MTNSFFNILVFSWIAVALFIFPAILKIAAPYGRHTTSKWGVLIDNRLGWILMELPALLVFALFYLLGSGEKPEVTWVFFGLWITHYINRTLIFPFRLRTNGKKMPVAIVLMAVCFNFVNGFINGYYLGTMATSAEYPAAWFFDPRFLAGLILFIFGMAVNWQSDNILIHLRKPGDTGYVIPQKGFFRLVSCPNHFGEMIEWSGFALMAWNWAAVAFAVWTIANLLPRALHHHKWYKGKFADYPASRKAVIPYIL